MHMNNKWVAYEFILSLYSELFHKHLYKFFNIFVPICPIAVKVTVMLV